MITTQNLTFRYETEADAPSTPVLDGIDLSIARGSFVAILGHNGSGKSTLAKQFNAILTPTEGCVFVDGIDTHNDELLFEIRHRVGMVFQNPDNQIVASIVEEDVAFAPENLGLAPYKIRTRVDTALSQVDMLRYKDHAVSQLSGGQKQRVAIAGILAMQPECIVLDEPTAMLDPKGRAEIMRTIKQLHAQGTTVILITHFMDEAVQAQRVVVIEEGSLILDGTPREVFSHVARLQQVGLDVPQVTELCYLLQQQGFDLPHQVLTPDECVVALQQLLPPPQRSQT